MKKTLVLASALISSALFAQKPYFQQDVAYTINVTLDDVKHELTADETLIYKNNSPDALPFIWMHVWPNAYKQNGTALEKQLTKNGETGLHFAKDEERGYIDQLDFKVDGQAVKTEAHPVHTDIIKIVLNTPLQPGQQITITTPFHVKIPSGKFSRLGHIDQQYQITQWYPKPAVYDRNGWNEIPYLDQGEFYSEFGKYDVFIKVPKNYVLGATGDLQNNPDEVKFMNDLAAKTKDIEKYDKKDESFPASDAEFKTLHFHQENVHDFAWFCDKRYHVLKGDVELPHSKRHVTTWVMFTNQYADLWKDGIQYVNDALFYYSKWNGDYAYNQCTAVDGALSAGGGMEYPNITVIGGVSNPFMLENVIMHEVGHNWFYGMLGSNERVHGWMDEGINSFNELRYVETKYPTAALVGGKNGPSAVASKFDLDRYKQKAQYYQLYTFSCHQNMDQPIETHAADFTSTNYAAIMYMKTAIVFDYLRSYLGDEVFDNAMQTYFDRWHFKHPMPEDLRKVLEETTGKQLGWFFDDMINSNKRLDYKVTKAKNTGSGWNIGVRNVGEILGPVMLCGVKDGKVTQTVWHDGFTGEQTITMPAGDYDYFMIDQPEDMPEWNRKNNTIETSGLFKKAEPFKLQLAGSLDNPTRTQLFVAPAIGWNNYDKFMLGAAFYNRAVMQKPMEWTVMPMYAFGTKQLNGHADLFFNVRPHEAFQRINFGVKVNRYSYYVKPASDSPIVIPERSFSWLKISPELNIDFKKQKANGPYSHSLQLRGVFLYRDVTQRSIYIVNGVQSTTTSYQTINDKFYELSYQIKNKNTLFPWDIRATAQKGINFTKIMATSHLKITLTKKKALNLRVFGGTFLDATGGVFYRYRMSGFSAEAISNQDYLFDNIFLGRSEQTGLLSKQFVEDDGGFKMYSPVGQSKKWLVAANLNIPMPFNNKLLNRFSFFVDAGMSGIDGRAEDALMYDGGLVFSPFRRGILDIYVPLVYSKDFKNYLDATGDSFAQTIRFSLNLNKLSPTSLINNFSF